MKSRVLFAGLSAVLAAVTIGSILSAPPVSRLRAVPVSAHIVYNSETPDWFLSFFPSVSNGAPFFPDLGKPDQTVSKHWKKYFQVLENKPLTVATVPFGGRARRDTWVAVSELGGPAALALRWRLILFPPKEVSPARPHAAWPVWRFEHPSLPGWAKVRFAVTESFLICSISTDSHDIYRLLDTADGRAASKMKGR